MKHILLVTIAFSRVRQSRSLPKELIRRIPMCGLSANKTRLSLAGHFGWGLIMVMDEGWHVYWKNPGDSGIGSQDQVAIAIGYQGR